MKLNWAERWVVNNPSRVFQQRLEIGWLQRHLALPSGATVLEVGCGRGAGADLILKKFQLERMHAMDLDVDMIRRAKKYLSPHQRERVSSYAGDLTHLPHPSATFDAVFGFGVLHHVPDWPRALAEVTRVLKIGGAYILEEIYPSVYQNFITRHILLHPEEGRFYSNHLKEALRAVHLSLQGVLECKQLGLLAVLVKNG
jgi:ubiquinone/menaquinone biosynthesis C-methylase UbiE